MRAIGSRELKAPRLGEVLRHVREHQEVYAVTHHGRVIAQLVPVEAAPEPADDIESARIEELWAEMDTLAAEIGREWPEGVSAADAVSEDRRDL